MKITYGVTAKNKHGNKEWTEAPDRTTREAKTDRFRPLSDAAKKVNTRDKFVKERFEILIE